MLIPAEQNPQHVHGVIVPKQNHGACLQPSSSKAVSKNEELIRFSGYLESTLQIDPPKSTTRKNVGFLGDGGRIHPTSSRLGR